MFLWTFRKNEKDVINLYNTLSPVMQIATGGTMLNFGYWTSKHLDPVSAQNNLCNVFGDLAELSTAKNAIDADASSCVIISPYLNFLGKNHTTFFKYYLQENF